MLSAGATPAAESQIGTVLMTYDGSASEVELSPAPGRAYAMLPIPASKLFLLHVQAQQNPCFTSKRTKLAPCEG